MAHDKNLPTVTILHPSSTILRELGSLSFRTTQVKSEEDLIRNGVDLSLEDARRIGEELAMNMVVGNVGEYEWRLES